MRKGSSGWFGFPALVVIAATTCLPAGADGTAELFFDVLPVTLDGRCLVPVRPIFEWLGAVVVYGDRHVEAFRSDEGAVPQVELWVDRTEARVSGAPYELDVAPQLRAGRIFVPLRFVAESFGVWVQPEGREIELSLPQESLKTAMAIPPHPQSLLGKLWHLAEQYYGLAPVGDGSSETPNWDLYCEQRQEELLAEFGEEASALLEAHCQERVVEGIRIRDGRVDGDEKNGWLLVRVAYADGEKRNEHFACVLESAGWRMRYATGDFGFEQSVGTAVVPD